MNLVICILAGLAAILAIFHGPMVILVCCGIGTACAAWILYSLIAGGLKLRLTWLLASSLLIGYCYGTFSVELAALLDGAAPLTYIGIDRNWIAFALLLVMLACLTLCIAGRFEPPLFRDTDVSEISWRQERFLWLALAFSTVAFLHGDLSLQGTAVTGGRMSVIGAIANAALQILAPVAAVGIVQTSGIRRMRLIAITGAALLLSLPLSRRTFIYICITLLFAVGRLAGRNWKLSLTRKVMVVLVVAPVLLTASMVFYALRLASWQMGGGGATIVQILKVAERTSFTDWKDVRRAEGENVQQRPAFLVIYLSLLGRGGDTPSPLYGQDLALGAGMAIPDPIFRLFGVSKAPLQSVSTEEVLANEHFGLSDTDDANSILTGGLIDFGWVGALLYPVLMCGVVRVIFGFARQILPPDARLIGAVWIIFLFLETELSVGTYVVSLRDLSVVLCAWTIISWLPGITRSRRRVLALSRV